MNEDDYNLTRLARTLGPKGHRNITFESLAKHPDWYVREALAKNPNTPANVLNLLAYDEDTYVRQAVLDNPNATPEMVDYILKHTKNVQFVKMLNKKPLAIFLKSDII